MTSEVPSRVLQGRRDVVFCFLFIDVPLKIYKGLLGDQEIFLGGGGNVQKKEAIEFKI